MAVIMHTGVYNPVLNSHGYALKRVYSFTSDFKVHTEWVHKMYTSMQGIRSKFSARRLSEGENYYIYKMPERVLFAVASYGTFGVSLISHMNKEIADKYREMAGKFEDEGK